VALDQIKMSAEWAQNTRLAAELAGCINFLKKLAVHPGVGDTRLTISKFPRNPPRSWAAWHPPAFEQLA
jgi:hypothetical protein